MKKFDKYTTLAGPAIVAAGCSFLAIGVPVSAREPSQSTRLVVIEQNILEAAKDGYENKCYQAVLAAFDGGATREFSYTEAV